MTILPIAYWPPISYIDLLLKGNAIIEINENYQKRSIRNRASILTSQGEKILSIPLVKGKNAKLPINQVIISYDENWQHTHLESIKTSYRNAPYYQYYIEAITGLIENKDANLLNYSFAILRWIMDTFGEYDRDLDVTSDFTGVTYNKDSCIKPYRQVFEQQIGFVNNDLSILDLIFNVGYEIPLYFAD